VNDNNPIPRRKKKMRINNNITALNSANKLAANQTNLAKSTEKLSSGLRVNRAGDDASGLAISEKLRAQVRGLNQATRNAQDGISLLNVAEGALNETEAIAQRVRELAVQAANDTLTGPDRDIIQNEVNALVEEVDRIASQTQFNTQVLSGGNYNGKVFQVGANKDQNMDIDLESMEADVLDLDTANLETQSGANDAIELADNAIEAISIERGRIGAYTNRLENIINVNTVASENTSAAESRIRDVDMAREMMSFTKNNILSQAAQAMLAQANQLPQGVLQLLR
jgi:flagellin